MAITTKINDPLLDVVEQIRVHGREKGLVIFYGYVGGGEGSVQWNEEHGGGWQEFLACANALGGRTLYLDWAPLEESQIDELLEKAPPLEQDAPEELARQLRAFREKVEGYRDKVGLTATVDLAFACEGIFHTFEITADWFEAFEDLAPETEEGEDVVEKVQGPLIEEWAPKLASDPKYASCKTGGQRRYLLQKLAGEKYERFPVSEILSRANEIYEVDIRPENERRLREEVRGLKEHGATLSAISGKLGISVWRVRALLGEQTS